MELNAFAPSLLALALGEVLSGLFARRTQSVLFEILQAKIPPGIVGPSLSETSVSRRLDAAITSVASIPTLYLTMLALSSVRPLEPFATGWVGMAIGLIGTLALFGYGWSKESLEIHRVKLCYMSVPTAVLFVMNAAGLVVQNLT